MQCACCQERDNAAAWQWQQAAAVQNQADLDMNLLQNLDPSPASNPHHNPAPAPQLA